MLICSDLLYLGLTEWPFDRALLCTARVMSRGVCTLLYSRLPSLLPTDLHTPDLHLHVCRYSTVSVLLIPLGTLLCSTDSTLHTYSTYPPRTPLLGTPPFTVHQKDSTAQHIDSQRHSRPNKQPHHIHISSTLPWANTPIPIAFRAYPIYPK